MHRRIASLLIAACTLALAMPMAGQDNRAVGFLTQEKSTAPALDIAMSYIRQNAEKRQMTEEDLALVVVRDQYLTRHNGTTHIYLSQKLHGIEVINTDLSINISRDGRVINMRNTLVPDLEAAVNARTPSLSAAGAIRSAAKQLGLAVTERLARLEKIGGAAREARFSGAGVSLEEIPAKLVYYALEDGSARLAWDLIVLTPDQQHWWNLWVDAANGKILGKADMIDHDAYRVFPLPFESPEDPGASYDLVMNPADSIASPFGWHDTNGAPGAEHTITWGNNVRAQEDTDGNNSGGFSPDGGPSLEFDFAFDDTLGPTGGTNQEAAIVSLFYWNNINHDIHYRYGFDPASGNFQLNNYGGGPGNQDPVLADAQDGSGTNNANFGTPRDGFAPRMQMFVWTYPFSQQVTVTAPGSIAGTYIANPSNDGGTYTGPARDLAIVDDGVAPTDDGCESINNDLTGKIGLLLWNEGACNSSVFVANAASAGAEAVIIIDNTDEPRTSFGGSPTIPSVAVGESDGLLFMSTINGGDTVTADIEDSATTVADRDSDMDAGIIHHEYGHGVSNRLTGGRNKVNCLEGDQQGGEGWSDWWALAFTAQPTDLSTDARGVGTYVQFEPPTGPGIRAFPYTTDMNVNPHTYEDIATAGVPHGVGSVWAAMLWEVYWKLVDTDDDGSPDTFDADLYTGTGGNNTAIQLVTDGLKLQGCNPTFVDARDGILLADQNNNGGANECRIWEAFAKRGLGFSAGDGGSQNTLNVTEAFDLPPQCSQAVCGNNTIEGGEVCDGTDLGGESCQSQIGCVGGTLVCNGTCSGFITTSCTGPNGTLESPEECDDPDFGGLLCTDLGCSGGFLTCNGDCTIDTTSCTGCCAEVTEPCTEDIDCCSGNCSNGKPSTRTCQP